MSRRVLSVLVAGLLLAATVTLVRAQSTSRPPSRLEPQPSSVIAFFKTEQGRRALRESAKPSAQEFLSWVGEDTSRLQTKSAPPTRGGTPDPGASTADSGTLSSSCGTSAGTKFNLEPAANALPQNEESLDFKLNGVSSGVDLIVSAANEPVRPTIPSGTGYYVSRDADCAPEFEGGTPLIPDPLAVGNMFGLGDPVAVFDPSRDVFFVADLRLNVIDDTTATTAIGVVRSPASRLRNTTSCPNGTHDESEAATCWPVREAVLGKASTPTEFMDKPHMAVDERSSGTGGQVYVVATEFTTAGTEIQLIACSNDLQTCSPSQTVSGTDDAVQFPHVAVRPTGSIAITWTNRVPNGSGGVNIEVKYRSCSVSAVPAAPSCLDTSLVHLEKKPLLGFDPSTGIGPLSAQDFRVDTYPKVDARKDTNGIEMYVVWDRCKITLIANFVCPDADVLMKATANNGGTWSSPVSVHTGSNDQFFSWIDVDRSRNIVNIIYLTSLSDSTFQHRFKVGLQHINPGGSTPDPITDGHTFASLLNDPSGDVFYGGVFIGDYIGVAARGNGSNGGSHAYGGFTYNNLQGTYSGVKAPNQNNHIARLDY